MSVMLLLTPFVSLRFVFAFGKWYVEKTWNGSYDDFHRLNKLAKWLSYPITWNQVYYFMDDGYINHRRFISIQTKNTIPMKYAR